MNPDRDALEGLINKNDVGSAESLPSVSPHLVDHLIQLFGPKPFTLDQVPEGASISDAATWFGGVQEGKGAILVYLTQLAQNKGVNANELTETESASTDPRRPGSSRRS